ncbi:MAG TPA: hypothetical protein PLY40_02240 [Bacillota bacterium]|nr:hypothetical protein [Bacillota bacterium]
MPSLRGGRFYAFRLPLLLIAALLFLFGLGLGGWHYYSTRVALTSAERIQQRLYENLQDLDSYYARFKTTLPGEAEETSYLVELWKSGSGLYRMEMTRTTGEGQAEVQVIVFDGSEAYIYNHEQGQFYPVDELESSRLPYLVLEDYWLTIAQSPQVNLVAEKNSRGRTYYLLEVIPDKPRRDRVRELAWLEAKSLLPVRIEVYDLNDSLTQVTTFEMLQLNPVLEATLFQV